MIHRAAPPGWKKKACYNKGFALSCYSNHMFSGRGEGWFRGNFVTMTIPQFFWSFCTKKIPSYMNRISCWIVGLEFDGRLDPFLWANQSFDVTQIPNRPLQNQTTFGLNKTFVDSIVCRLLELKTELLWVLFSVGGNQTTNRWTSLNIYTFNGQVCSSKSCHLADQ